MRTHLIHLDGSLKLLDKYNLQSETPFNSPYFAYGNILNNNDGRRLLSKDEVTSLYNSPMLWDHQLNGLWIQCTKGLTEQDVFFEALGKQKEDGTVLDLNTVGYYWFETDLNRFNYFTVSEEGFFIHSVRDPFSKMCVRFIQDVVVK